MEMTNKSTKHKHIFEQTTFHQFIDEIRLLFLITIFKYQTNNKYTMKTKTTLYKPLQSF